MRHIYEHTLYFLIEIFQIKINEEMGIIIDSTWKTDNNWYCLIDCSKNNWFSVSIDCPEVFKPKFKRKSLYGIYIYECYFQ